MPFDANAETHAHAAMRQINPALGAQFSKVIRFLAAYPERARQLSGKLAPETGSLDYITKTAVSFSASRSPKRPQPPGTKPDEMVSFVLQHYFNVPVASLDRVKTAHVRSMAAENIVGDLLERYLAETMEAAGWVWCSGSLVKAVDFIKPPATAAGNWQLLQVKNRDNSENSSSSAIRKGTSITKWHRSFSKKVGTNWDDFPDTTLREKLSETGFHDFALKYLRSLQPENNNARLSKKR